MNNKLYLLVIGAVVLVGGYFLVKGQSSSTTNQEVSTTESQSTIVIENVSPTLDAATEQNVVKYSESGFSPKSLEVAVGTGVTFVNEGDSPMWVASAPHPQHTNLPGFDQLKSAAKGDSYTYTFEKVGLWKYHNHLDATQFGEVVVKQ